MNAAQHQVIDQDAAYDAAFIDLKTNPLRRAERAEAWQGLLDSLTGPSPNAQHSRLIESLAGLDADLIAATDAVKSRGRMLLLDAIVCTAFDDALMAQAKGEPRAAGMDVLGAVRIVHKLARLYDGLANSNSSAESMATDLADDARRLVRGAQ